MHEVELKKVGVKALVLDSLLDDERIERTSREDALRKMAEYGEVQPDSFRLNKFRSFEVALMSGSIDIPPGYGMFYMSAYVLPNEAGESDRG